MDRKIFKGLAIGEYEHEFDRKALNVLEGTPGLEPLTKKIMELGVERLIKIQYTGSYIKASESNFQDLYKLFTEAVETLDLYCTPELYITWDYGINAMAIGVEKPIVVLNSGCVDLLTEDELRFIIGHELGHIKSRHMLYHTMAQYINVIAAFLGNLTLGIGNLLSYGLKIALMHWMRMSEFTSDRAGLLCCQNLDAANSVMVKMAGIPKKYFDQINVEDFVKQATEFDELDYNTYNKIVKILTTMNNTHPWTVLRNAEINKWVNNGFYDAVLNRDRSQQSQTRARFCCFCGNPMNGTDNFCSRCGGKVS